MTRAPLTRALTALAITSILGFTPIRGRAGPATTRKPQRVVVLGDAPEDERRTHGIAEAIRSVVGGELGVTEERGKSASAAEARALLDAALGDKTVDVVVAASFFVGREALRRGPLPKPVLAAALADPSLLDAPQSGEGSGVKNLAYFGDRGAYTRDLTTMKELGMERPALLVGRSALAAAPELSPRLIERARAQGLAASVVAVDGADPAAALGGLPQGTDSVALVLVDELSAKSVGELVRAVEARGLRSYSFRGEADVNLGVAAGLADARGAEQLARRAAIIVSRLLEGEQASGLPVAFKRPEQLTVNVGAAARLRWSLPFVVLSEAVLVGEPAPGAAGGERLTVRAAVDEVLAKNLDFDASKQRLESANEDQAKALSYLLPKVDLGVQGTMIDASRAGASFGNAPERQLLGSIEGKALLYSEKAWANVSIQGRLAHVREELRSAERLDLVLEAAKAYFGVLQTAVLARVRMDNAKRTRANLSVARAKQDAGSAMESEVLRWEAQLASDRREVLRARSLRGLAEMQLNRLRHRPLADVVPVAPESFERELGQLIPSEALARVQDAESLRALTQLFVEEAQARSPELRAADEAVLATERLVASAWRTLYLPQVGVGGRIFWRLAKGGAGSAPPPTLDPATASALPPALLPLLSSLPGPIEDPSWEVAAQLTLPLPIDVAVYSDIRRAEADLRQRAQERDSAREKIEQRVRASVELMRASFPGLQLAQQAAGAAKKNLGLVEQAYAAGAIGYLDLLDARNAALLTEQGAVSAAYDLMTDELQVERSIGWFQFMAEKEERDAWYSKIIERVARR